jgi:predicted amidohydrolase
VDRQNFLSSQGKSKTLQTRTGIVLGVALVGFICYSLQGRSSDPERVGRQVRVLSISFRDKPLETIAQLVDREASRGADLVALPETWRGQKNESPETLEGPTITTMAALAKKHHTYIVCPIDRKHGVQRLNSAVLLDRNGKVVCVYDKVYPYWSEFDLKQKVEVGKEAPVYQADFGKVGFGICFDVNFPEVWKRLADRGAEIVIWPSAYSAGTSLQAHAINHHYYIITS